MLSEVLKESISQLNTSDIIRLKLIIDEMYEKEKSLKPHFRTLVYNVKNPHVHRENSKTNYYKKKELKNTKSMTLKE